VSPLLLLLATAALCILGAVGLGTSAIMQEQADRRKFRDRLTRTVACYQAANRSTVATRSAPNRTSPLGRLKGATAKLFGYTAPPTQQGPARRGKLRWWLILGSTLAVARAIALLLAIFVGKWSLLIVPVAWVMLCRSVFKWIAQRRSDALYQQFPDAIGIIVRAVRVGIPLSEGIRTVAKEAPSPTAQEFAALVDQLSIGVTLDTAVHDMAARNNVVEYRFFATVLALQSQTGGGLAEALDGLADVIRRRLALKDRGKALAAEAKTSIAILASLPFVTGGALAVLNPAYIARLFIDPGCEKVLAAAIFMLTGGLLVMRGMIRKALS
jgi:tight adherence protein B